MSTGIAGAEIAWQREVGRCESEFVGSVAAEAVGFDCSGAASHGRCCEQSDVFGGELRSERLQVGFNVETKRCVDLSAAALDLVPSKVGTPSTPYKKAIYPAMVMDDRLVTQGRVDEHDH